MDESAEELELEPLFDYSRVQPISFVSLDEDDDLFDSDKPLVLSPKRLKRAEPASCDAIKPVVCDDKDEEDWLPPPPKSLTGQRKVEEEDSTIKALRLKKQELASFAKSAEDVLRAVEEGARKQLGSSIQSSSGSETVKAHVDRKKIVISIQDKDGLNNYRVYADEKLGRIFQVYADKVKRDLGSLVFTFDGDKVGPVASPDSLGMEDEDIIEVRTK